MARELAVPEVQEVIACCSKLVLDRIFRASLAHPPEAQRVKVVWISNVFQGISEEISHPGPGFSNLVSLLGFVSLIATLLGLADLKLRRRAKAPETTTVATLLVVMPRSRLVGSNSDGCYKDLFAEQIYPCFTSSPVWGFLISSPHRRLLMVERLLGRLTIPSSFNYSHGASAQIMATSSLQRRPLVLSSCDDERLLNPWLLLLSKPERDRMHVDLDMDGRLDGRLDHQSESDSALMLPFGILSPRPTSVRLPYPNIDRLFEALSPPYPATTSIPAAPKKRGFRELQHMEDTRNNADENDDRPTVGLLLSAPIAPIQSRAPRLTRT
ncbi:hypothetical protein F5X98DRAFT_381210 [Xylaria grammica]|nr:hypothetical protein F5X98DRAFT_381210 [Xylaria grammica]